MPDASEPRLAAAVSRRRVLAAATAGAAALAAGPGAVLATLLRATPEQTAGPFYVPFKPLSVDNDLVSAPGRDRPAEGRVLHVGGRVLDPSGRPVGGARVEIWQADASGEYAHPRRVDGGLRSGSDFQGVGHDATDETGAYRFRTIKPAPYGSVFWRRTPHIHFAVFAPGAGAWTTQMYFEGEALNESDFLLGRVPPEDRRLLVMAEQPPAGGMEPDSRRVVFDIVLGRPGVDRKPA